MRETIEYESAVRTPASEIASPRLKLVIVLALAVVMVFLVRIHLHNLNGQVLWKWLWRTLDIRPLAALMAIAVIPFFAGQWVYLRTGKVRLALLLIMAGNFAMQCAALPSQPHSKDRQRLEEIIENGINTSYYSAAKVLTDQQYAGVSSYDLMHGFPILMDQYLMGHAKFKPPGLILYFMVWIKLLGPTMLARSVAGYGIGLIGALAPGAAYWLLSLATGDRPGAFYGASYLALTPSLVLFLPQTDQMYVPVAMGLIGLWIIAIRSGRAIQGLLFGLAMAVALFFTYTFLMLGVFLGVYTILFMGDQGKNGIEIVIRQALLAASAFGAFYVVLSVAYGFDPMEVYQTSIRLEQLDSINRQPWPWPRYLYTDWLDVPLGTGWLSVPLFLFGLVGMIGQRIPHDARVRFSLIGALQIAVALGVGVFHGENARLLMLLFPLIMLPIGVELSRWPAAYRMAVFAALWLITVVVCQNMVFIHQPIDNLTILPFAT